MKATMRVLFAFLILNFGFGVTTLSAQPATGKGKGHIEVLYFHGKQRCYTCNAIERLTKEVIENEFAEQYKRGEIVFKVIDISTDSGEKIADNYEVSWSSLYINRWHGGKEIRNNLTDAGFKYAKNSPDMFKSVVRKQLQSLLK